MSFGYGQYFIIVILAWALLVFLYQKRTKQFFLWVKEHWFFNRSKANRISSILYLLGILFLMLAVLDLRGPEEVVTGKTSDQKTIVLIDSSASMLAEDVRPNRYEKAIVLARHYIKRAVGQKISVMVFSDGTKRMVPFTQDVNLVDARLDVLKNENISRGGTSLSLAIKESLQYFINDKEDPQGNILIFTDAEETDGGIDFKVPKGISIGVVGIGTRKGAAVPNRDKNGVSRGNKTYEGKVIISKLDEPFLKKLGDKIEYYKYWVATSYSLPTSEILEFFSRSHNEKNENNSFRVRPVLANYLIVPGVIFLCLSFLIGRRKIFVMTSLLVIISFSTFASSEEKKEKSVKTLELEKRFAEGILDDEGKKALATSLLKDDFSQEAAVLYNEILDKKVSDQNKIHKFNEATAQVKSGDLKNGIENFNNMVDFLEENPTEENKKLLETVKSNIAKLFKQSNSSQSSKQSKKSNEGDKNDQEDKKNQDDQGKQGENKDQQNKDQNNGDDKNKDEKENKSGNDNQKDKKNDQSKSESKEEKQNRQKKLPALLKQLINEDNQLQKELIDAKTTKRKSQGSKDW